MPTPGDLRLDDGFKRRKPARTRMICWFSLSTLAIATALSMSAFAHRKVATQVHNCPMRWAGGSDIFEGSCWCGGDSYCMCTPSLAIDTIIELPDENSGLVREVLVIRRKDNGKLACVGGFVMVGETMEQAVRREVMEETGLEVEHLRMLPKVYDSPSRDTRRHTVSVAYAVQVRSLSLANQRPGEEEAALVTLPLMDLGLMGQRGDFDFDHGQILRDYLDSGLNAISRSTLEEELQAGEEERHRWTMD
ncbi:unnamed protein product [Discosporangium mesarthrocarpum]